MQNFLKANDLYRKYFMWLKPEDIEQGELVLWLEKNNYDFTSIPNNVYTTSFKQKIVNKILGLRPGLSDLLIVLKRGSLLFLEIKQKKYRIVKKNGELGKLRKKNDLSKEQKKWRDILNKINNVSYEVAFGFTEAKYIIEKYEKL